MRKVVVLLSCDNKSIGTPNRFEALEVLPSRSLKDKRLESKIDRSPWCPPQTPMARSCPSIKTDKANATEEQL
jgi:hypothetical protein